MNQQNEQHVEVSVELKDDLSKGNDYNVLIVDGGNHHHSFEKLNNPNHPHTITWVLKGNASGGEFCALDDKENPGFAWLVKKPDEKVFHKLQRVGKNKLTVHNHHVDKTSEGTWYYQLFARFGDKVFGVPLTFAAGPANNPNPSIKNN